MSFVNWFHKNIAEGNIEVDTTLLKANGGAGFKAGMLMALRANGEDVFFQKADGTTKPVYGVSLDNDDECEGSGKVTVATGQGWRFEIQLKDTELLADIAVGANTLYTVGTKVYAGATADAGKYTTVAAGDAIGEVTKAPTAANSYTLGIKLLK